MSEPGFARETPIHPDEIALTPDVQVRSRLAWPNDGLGEQGGDEMKKMLFAAVAMLAVSAPLEAADPGRVVGGQLDHVRSEMRGSGYRETHDQTIGSLRSGAHERFEVSLREGTSYRIIGVCDEDCDDLDIVLYDENGNEIDSDREDDSIPIVEVSPRWDGKFEVRVNMASCEIAPCQYGVVVMGR